MDTFDILQLAALATFLLVFAARSALMFAVQGKNPFTLGAGKKGASRVLEALMPVATAAWLAALLWSTLGGRDALPGPLDATVVDADWARTAGTVLLGASVALFTWALASFGASWRVGIDTRSPGELVMNGVFRYTRNPIFVSMDMFFLGTFLVQGTAFFLAAALAAVGAIHIQILQEESFLAGHYGEAYQRYRKEVPRYLGRRGGAGVDSTITAGQRSA